jgi:hypothetical protein
MLRFTRFLTPLFPFVQSSFALSAMALLAVTAALFAFANAGRSA